MYEVTYYDNKMGMTRTVIMTKMEWNTDTKSQLNATEHCGCLDFYISVY